MYIFLQLNNENLISLSWKLYLEIIFWYKFIHVFNSAIYASELFSVLKRNHRMVIIIYHKLN